MSLSRLLPNASRAKTGKSIEQLIYIATTKWGWNYRDFQETPIPIILTNYKLYAKEIKEQNKKR